MRPLIQGAELQISWLAKSGLASTVWMLRHSAWASDTSSEMMTAGMRQMDGTEPVRDRVRPGGRAGRRCHEVMR